MASRVFVVTVGYRSDVVLDELFAAGLQGDPLILLAGLAFDEEAERELERVMGEVEERLPRAARVERRVYHGGFDQVLESLVSDLLALWDGRTELAFLLSGGSRLLVLASMVAASVLAQEYGDQVRVLVGRDYSPTHLYEIHVHAIGLLRIISPTQYRVLSLLAERGKATTGQIAKSLGLSPPAVSRALRTLEHYGLVEKAKGRGYYSITERGKILLILSKLIGQ